MKLKTISQTKLLLKKPIIYLDVFVFEFFGIFPFLLPKSHGYFLNSEPNYTLTNLILSSVYATICYAYHWVKGHVIFLASMS